MQQIIKYGPIMTFALIGNVIGHYVYGGFTARLIGGIALAVAYAFIAVALKASRHRQI